MRQFDPTERPSAFAAEKANALIREALSLIARVVIDEPEQDRDTFIAGTADKFRGLMDGLLDLRAKADDLAASFDPID